MLRSHPRVIWYGSKKCSGLSDQLSRGAIWRIGVWRDSFIPNRAWRLEFDLLVNTAHCPQTEGVRGFLQDCKTRCVIVNPRNSHLVQQLSAKLVPHSDIRKHLDLAYYLITNIFHPKFHKCIRNEHLKDSCLWRTRVVNHCTCWSSLGFPSTICENKVRVSERMRIVPPGRHGTQHRSG